MKPSRPASSQAWRCEHAHQVTPNSMEADEYRSCGVYADEWTYLPSAPCPTRCHAWAANAGAGPRCCTSTAIIAINICMNVKLMTAPSHYY